MTEFKLVPRDVLAGLVKEIEHKTCDHGDTYRGGNIWTICQSCGKEWADDNGGKPEFKWPECVESARAILAAPQQAAEQPSYNTEIERVIARLDSSDPDFDDCADAVALIHRLAAEIKGPDGYATWRDAAIAERVRRVSAEQPAPIPTSKRSPTEQALRDVRRHTRCYLAFPDQSSDEVLRMIHVVADDAIKKLEAGLTRPAAPEGE